MVISVMEKEKAVKGDWECWGFRILDGVVREGLLEKKAFEVNLKETSV